jgi:hypothetical protein
MRRNNTIDVYAPDRRRHQPGPGNARNTPDLTRTGCLLAGKANAQAGCRKSTGFGVITRVRRLAPSVMNRGLLAR